VGPRVTVTLGRVAVFLAWASTFSTESLGRALGVVGTRVRLDCRLEVATGIVVPGVEV
jgi:hypothetical protein